MSGWRSQFLAGYRSDDSRPLREWVMLVIAEMNRWAMNRSTYG